jgi:hypothetical protein
MNRVSSFQCRDEILDQVIISSQCNRRKHDPLQRPRKHFETGGALAKRVTFVYDQNQTILYRLRAEPENV